MKEFAIGVTINGHLYERSVSPTLRLVDFIRHDVGLHGTKISCGSQVCGVCTVLVDGEPVSSCAFLAIDVDGCEVTTIEGVADGRELNEFQQALLACGGVQCGYCTPGFVMTMESIVRERGGHSMSKSDIQHAFEGNICRCTGYRQILNAASSCLERPGCANSPASADDHESRVDV